MVQSRNSYTEFYKRRTYFFVRSYRNIYDLILRVYFLFLQDSCIRPVLLLKHHLIYIYIYIYIAISFLLSSCYLLLLSNQNQSFFFISSPYPNQVYDKQRKKRFSVVICVCCIMSCSEIFLSQNGVFQRSLGCNKKKIVTNHGGDFL